MEGRYSGGAAGRIALSVAMTVNARADVSVKREMIPYQEREKQECVTVGIR